MGHVGPHYNFVTSETPIGTTFLGRPPTFGQGIMVLQFFLGLTPYYFVFLYGFFLNMDA